MGQQKIVNKYCFQDLARSWQAHHFDLTKPTQFLYPQSQIFVVQDPARSWQVDNFDLTNTIFLTQPPTLKIRNCPEENKFLTQIKKNYQNQFLLAVTYIKLT